jgi:hypothetical protein
MSPIEPAELFDYDSCMKAEIMQSSKCSQTAMLIDFMRSRGIKFDNMKR